MLCTFQIFNDDANFSGFLGDIAVFLFSYFDREGKMVSALPFLPY